jgi:hypothetical protein
MNALTTTAMPLQDMQTLAVAIAKSALFGIRTPEQALVLMAIAQAEGRHPVEAARDYDIINNRPAKKAEAMLRDFIQAGGKVQWHSLTDELADATFTHPQTGEVRIDWDMKRAQTAFGKKEMYAKFPRQMLRSRVVSEGVRTLWPLATSGMYEPGEAADIPPEHNGPTLEAKPEREAMNAEVPLKAAAAPMPRGARVAEKAAVYEAQPDGPQPERKTWRQLADAMEIAERDSMTPQELGLLIAKAENQEILRLAREGPYSDGKARIIAAYERAETRYLADPPDPPETAGDLPEVEIIGADKAAAG